MLEKKEDIFLNTPITNVEMLDDQSVEITDDSGKKYSGKAVIVAVPVTILQKGMIKFKPELPEEKKKSL